MHTDTWDHSYEHAKHSYHTKPHPPTEHPAYTTTHGPNHNNVTNHSDLQPSSTVAMVGLEPKTALKAFKPMSVTF